MAVRLRQRTQVNLTSRIREKPTSRVYLGLRPQAVPPQLDCLGSDHSFCRFGGWFERQAIVCEAVVCAKRWLKSLRLLSFLTTMNWGSLRDLYRAAGTKAHRQIHTESTLALSKHSELQR